MRTAVKILFTVSLSGFMYFMGLLRSDTLEYNRGFNECIDTVSNMLEAQLKSDTSVTRLIIVNPDTVTYILKRKDAL